MGMMIQRHKKKKSAPEPFTPVKEELSNTSKGSKRKVKGVEK